MKLRIARKMVRDRYTGNYSNHQLTLAFKRVKKCKQPDSLHKAMTCARTVEHSRTWGTRAGLIQTKSILINSIPFDVIGVVQVWEKKS